jgi:hypothetical protein
LIGCDVEQGPNPTFVEKKCTPTTGLLDFGWSVHGRVINDGEAGTVVIESDLRQGREVWTKSVSIDGGDTSWTVKFK